MILVLCWWTVNTLISPKAVCYLTDFYVVCALKSLFLCTS